MAAGNNTPCCTACSGPFPTSRWGAEASSPFPAPGPAAGSLSLARMGEGAGQQPGQGCPRHAGAPSNHLFQGCGCSRADGPRARAQIPR